MGRLRIQNGADLKKYFLPLRRKIKKGGYRETKSLEIRLKMLGSVVQVLSNADDIFFGRTTHVETVVSPGWKGL